MKVFLIFAVLLAAVSGELRRVCYYTNWSQYRNSPGKFYPENVDPNLCTHLIYAFATLNGNQLKAFEWNDESTPWMKGMFERFSQIKRQNPALKTLLAVGGWNLASTPFTQMVATDASRREFASTAVQFLRTNKFDGLDLDWEYPANRGSPPGDRHKFTELVMTIHNEFENEAQRTGGERLLLSAAVGAGKEKIDTAYEIPEISTYLDFINLMTYDFHGGSFDDHMGHNSPLYGRTGETGNETYFNVDFAAQYWVQKGAPKSKLNIGLPVYGRTFKLPYGSTDSRVGAPASGPGEAGQYTREAGFLSYYEICDILKNGGQKFYIAEQQVPYAVRRDLWVGYDDQSSLCIKTEYIKNNGFGGVMIWSLDLDDFTGSCGQGKYPLLRAIRDALNSPNPCPGIPNQQVHTQTPPQTFTQPINPTVYTQPQTTYVPPPNTPQVTTQIPYVPQATTQAPAIFTSDSSLKMHSLIPVNSYEFDCSYRTNGYYPSPTSCFQYYICALQQAFRTDCHPGLQFNRITGYCDFADHVTCNNNGGQAQPVQNNNGGQVQPVQTNAAVFVPQIMTTAQPANNPGPTGDFCDHKADGYYGDPKDCHYFYICNFGTTTRTNCPPGTVFNEQLITCDFPSHTHTCKN